MYKLYGEDALKKMAKNAAFVASSTAVPESIARGEYAIGVTGEANIAKYILEGAPVTYVYPEEGTGARFDASAIIAVILILKQSCLWILSLLARG